MERAEHADARVVREQQSEKARPPRYQATAQGQPADDKGQGCGGEKDHPPPQIIQLGPCEGSREILQFNNDPRTGASRFSPQLAQINCARPRCGDVVNMSPLDVNPLGQLIYIAQAPSVPHNQQAPGQEHCRLGPLCVVWI